MRVSRVDFAGPTRSVKKTPQGGLCVEAAVARTGVLDYSDGQRSWREYRSPEEVFDDDSLATLRGATVTDKHPDKLVTPETFASVSKGHAHDDVRRDGNLVVADLMVQDAALCALVESGERREVSCGYTCEVVPTPGVTPEGERYDAVQTKIRHNHVALLPPGEGRSGPEVSLRLDGAAVEVRPCGAGEPMKKLKIRGVEFRLDADDGKAIDDKGVDKAQDAVTELEMKADADGAELAAVKTALMKALETVAAAAAKLAAANAATPPPVTEAAVPDDVQYANIARRGALRESAARVLGPEAKLSAVRAVLTRVWYAHPAVRPGRRDDGVRGSTGAASQ